jgi:hypothetical protein
MSSVRGQQIKAGGQYPNVSRAEFRELLTSLGLDTANMNSTVIPLGGVAVNRRDYAEGAEGDKGYYTDAALLKMLSCWPAKAVVVNFGDWQDAFCHWMVVKDVYETPRDLSMEARVGRVRQRGPVSRATHYIARQPQGELAPGWLVRPLVIENMSDPGRRVNPRRVLLLPFGEVYDGSAGSLERMKAVLKPRREENAAGIFGPAVARRARLTTPEAVIEAIGGQAAPAGAGATRGAMTETIPLPFGALVKDAERAKPAAGPATPEWCAKVPCITLPSGARVMAKEHVDDAVKARMGALIDAMLRELGDCGIIVR